MPDLALLGEKNGKESAVADVVFVHGLGGNSVGTWRNRSTRSTWPKLLAEQETQFAVWTLSHEAGRWFWTGQAMNLLDAGGSVADRLQGQGIGQRPIVFVGHSLGGLLIKEVLRHCSDNPGNEFESSIATKTKGVIFLATPHTGSALASVGTGLPAVLIVGGLIGMLISMIVAGSAEITDHWSTIMFLAVVLFGSAGWAFRFAPIVRSMRRHDSNLKLLDRWWFPPRSNGSRYNSRYFYETCRWLGLFYIVSPDSANHKDRGTAIYADHFEIAKPHGLNSHAYISVRQAIYLQLGLDWRPHKELTEVLATSQHSDLRPLSWLKSQAAPILSAVFIVAGVAQSLPQDLRQSVDVSIYNIVTKSVEWVLGRPTPTYEQHINVLDRREKDMDQLLELMRKGRNG